MSEIFRGGGGGGGDFCFLSICLHACKDENVEFSAFRFII